MGTHAPSHWKRRESCQSVNLYCAWTWWFFPCWGKLSRKLVGWCCCLVGCVLLSSSLSCVWLWLCKTSRVYIHNVSVCTGTTPALTHAGVVPVHTGAFWTYTRSPPPLPPPPSNTTTTQHSTEHTTQKQREEKRRRETEIPNGQTTQSKPMNVCTCFFFITGQGSVMMLNNERFARQYRYEPPRNCALVKKSSPSFGS